MNFSYCRFLCLFASFHLFAANVVAQQKTEQGEVSEGLRLSISLGKTRFTAMEPIAVAITLQNVSDKDRMYAFSAFPNNEGFLVKDQLGVTVPLTTFGSESLKPPVVVVGNTPLALKPGQEISRTVILNRIVDLSRVGAYYLTIQRPVPKIAEKGLATVVSNTVKFEVVEPTPPPSFVNPFPERQHVEEKPVANFQWLSAPSVTWKEGETWTISAELFLKPDGPFLKLNKDVLSAYGATTPTNEPQLLARYGVLVQAVKKETIGNEEFWKLQILPTTDAPGNISSMPLYVWADKNGWTRKIQRIGWKAEFPFRKMGDYQMSLEALPGLPVELLPVQESKKLEGESDDDDELKLTVTTQPTDTGRTIEAIITAKGKPRLRVKQRWVAGASWWSEYEKEDFSQGTILRMKKTLTSSVPGAYLPPSSAPKPTAPQ
jgi:hypothetical protein